ncbi:unnamed protein product [Eruca vesicaria subsp. sativa]|uniref:Disease resistance protein n=1 Tax=Eruca vesicaria subsp. sativa TaxID=29727 RepID=A0ABC8J8V1_ERUVS|nr:unnamed protein product [Eruca vesicaria subsp. sativa]
MASKRTIQEWRHAVDVLNSYAAEFSGMEDKILPLLKYSYDNIKEEDVKSCLLYCALFPEDDNIIKETLIEYWICEGIIDASEGIERAENKGYAIIGSLVRASLLMETGLPDMKLLRMHDVVRDMALWITSDLRPQKEAYIVHAGVGLSEMPNVIVRRMSLMNNKILHLAGSPECIELTTFLMQHNLLENISSEFFKSMPKLAVLDLSYNDKLSRVPEGLSKLVSLKYLNLNRTGIRHLHIDLLQELKKLISLELPKCTSVAGISRLHNLKILKLYFPRDVGTIEELETLEHLEVLFTAFEDHPLPLWEKYLSSHRLTSCTRGLGIRNMKLESSGVSLPVIMDKLRIFRMDNCRISEIKIGTICFSSLSFVILINCKCLKELTFLMFAPNLIFLVIQNGIDVEDIINKGKAFRGGIESGTVPFQKLNRLALINVPELKNIYWNPLPFPRLQDLVVKGCPNLKKLPLNSQSGKQGEDGLIIMYGEREWIEGIEWEDQATKTH